MNNKEKLSLLNEEFNLSDFALFLSEIKNKKAYTNIINIIMGRSDIELYKIDVEEVVLNEEGKRAIRLDAKAIYTNANHYNV